MPKYRSNLAGLLSVVILFFASLSQALERTSFFLILNGPNNFSESLKTLENTGAHIRLTVPPRIVVGDIPLHSSEATLSSLGHVNKGRVSLTDVRSLGPLAISAALQWNKTASETVGPSGFQSRLVGEVSSEFEAPQGGAAISGNYSLKIQWNPVDGAYLYDIQICPTVDCATPLRRSLTDRSSLEMALLKTDPTNLYIRVRAGDRPSALDSLQDRFGPWSQPQGVSNTASVPSVTANPPQLTSPVEGYEAVGFSTVLEWTGSSVTRIQISKYADFRDTLVDQIVEGNEFTPPSSALHVGDRLYWRLSASGTQASGWSSARTYSILEPRSTHNDMFVNPEAPK